MTLFFVSFLYFVEIWFAHAKLKKKKVIAAIYIVTHCAHLLKFVNRSIYRERNIPITSINTRFDSVHNKLSTSFRMIRLISCLKVCLFWFSHHPNVISFMLLIYTYINSSTQSSNENNCVVQIINNLQRQWIAICINEEGMFCA